MADETPVLVFYIENTQPYNVIDITEVNIPFYVEITDLAHDSDLIEIEDLPIPAVACYIENSKVFNITMDSSGRDGKDGLPGKDGIGLPGKDGASITLESLTPEQLALLLQPATDAAADLYETITQLQQQINNIVVDSWFFLDLDGNVGTDYNLYSTKEISAYGMGTSGGGSGGGLILNVYGYNNLGGTYDNAILTNTFNAYTINLINTRLIAVEDGGSHIGLYEPKNANIQSHISSNSNPHNVTKELLNLGNVLNVASYSKLESDALLSLKLDAITFDDLFEKVNIGTLETPKYAIKAKYDFYSIGEVSAFGVGTNNSSGEGLIQTVYGISGLSATYSDANLTETFNAAAIKKIYEDVVTLQNGSLVNYSLTGTGNAITDVTKNGNSLNFVKGSSFSVTGHTHSFGDISELPSTLSEHGITDGVTTTVFNALANDFNTHVNSDVHLTTTQKNILSHLQIVNGKLQADIDFYSTGEISAFGLGDEGESGGDYDRLDKWEDYDSTKAGWVLSALLGKDLDTRTKANLTSILELNTRVDSIEGVDSDKNYIHIQGASSNTWTIAHTLNKYPSVTIIDSGGTEVIGDIKYIDTSTLIVTFTSGFSGKAILN